MMKATTKSNEINTLLSGMVGRERVATIEAGYCMTCGAGPDLEFTDPLSEHEYTISGMCQVCQDEVFG
jgi:hypothetical protein